MQYSRLPKVSDNGSTLESQGKTGDSPHPFVPTVSLLHSIALGAITQYSGSVASIPTGYQLCDGTNGTPDLRNKFVVGAGDTYAVGDEGGAETHTHDFGSVEHEHDLEEGGGVQAGINFSAHLPLVPVTGTTDAKSSLPIYYALAYIMEV